MTENSRPPFVARTVRKLSPLIIVGWLAVTLILTLASVGGDWKAAIPSPPSGWRRRTPCR